MSLPFIIYLIEVICDSHVIPLLATVSVIMWIVGFIFYMGNSSIAPEERGYESAQSYIKVYKSLKAIKVLVFLLALIAILLPSKESAYIMLAAYGVEKVIANPQVKELAGNSLKVLDKAMKDYLEESNPDSYTTKEVTTNEPK